MSKIWGNSQKQLTWTVGAHWVQTDSCGTCTWLNYVLRMWVTVVLLGLSVGTLVVEPAFTLSAWTGFLEAIPYKRDTLLSLDTEGRALVLPQAKWQPLLTPHGRPHSLRGCGFEISRGDEEEFKERELGKWCNYILFYFIKTFKSF